ncbi:MAG TPA: efflux RND transporter periplasmic adaptor subunit [Vicinamibacterales bacterium]
MKYACRGSLLALLVLAAGCSQKQALQAAQDDRPRAVAVQAAESRDVQRAVEVVGTLAAREEVVVSAEVAGRVARLARDLGDRVESGGALVELDPEKLEYRVEAQRAALAQARAKYGADGDGPLPPLEKVPAVVSSAAQLADARQQLEQAQTRLDTARAANDQALATARQLRADIEAQASSLRLAERDLRDAVVRAPFEGFIAERLVSPGQFVQPQTPVMRIVRLHPLKLIAEVPEKFAPWIETGRALEVRVDAYPGQVVTGRLERISPSVSQKSRAFAIEGNIPNADGRLKPGTFARVQITTDHVDRAVVIPASAVQSRYGTNRVFVVTDGHLVGREIVLGDHLGERVEVTQGLDAGTKIVASDVEQLTDGLKVTAR